MKVDIKELKQNHLPFYKREGDSCMDCKAALVKTVELKPKERVCVPLGFALAVPTGYEAVIRGRSGLSKNNGIVCSYGTIDSNYRGEVCAVLYNLSDKTFVIHDEDRVCQMKIQHSEKIFWNEVEELSDTNRGEEGFGSSGLN